MKTLCFYFSIIAVSLLFAVEGMASKKTVDELRSGLSKVSTPSDSLRVLFDVYDATPKEEKNTVGWEILKIAERTDAQDVLVEFIPQVTLLNMRSDETMRDLLVLAEKIDDTDHRKGIKLFININRAVNEASFLPEGDRQRALLRYAKTNISKSGDIYENILNLGRVVIFIGQSSQSNMYLEYLSRLEKLVEQLPEDCYYMRNLLYTTAANTHTYNGNAEKALESDRKLIEVIKGLEEKYRKMGREYRDYSRYYYLSYRRMLRNYRGLSLDEVRELYSKCAMLADHDEEIRKDFYENGRPTIYRLMAEKEYAEAVPKIKAALPRVKDRNVRRDLLRMLVVSSDSVGDDDTLLEALKEYNKSLQETLDRRAEESYVELQMRYDVNNLKSENTRLEIEKKDTELAGGQKLISIILVAMLVLAVIIMLLYRSHFALRQKNRELKEENEGLHKHIGELLDDGLPQGTQDVRRKD